jgi:hypothetical protein
MSSGLSLNSSFLMCRAFSENSWKFSCSRTKFARSSRISRERDRPHVRIFVRYLGHPGVSVFLSPAGTVRRALLESSQIPNVSMRNRVSDSRAAHRRPPSGGSSTPFSRFRSLGGLASQKGAGGHLTNTSGALPCATLLFIGGTLIRK